MEYEISKKFECVKSRVEYQSVRKHIFASLESLEWFIRRHRNRLTKAGALVKICGRQLVVEQVFDEAVIEIGLELASEITT